MIKPIIALALALGLVACAEPGPAAESSLAKVDAADFQAKVLAAEQPVLVDFYADWCGPCKLQEPHLAKLSQEFAGKVQTYKLDVDAAGEIAQQYGIRSIPTLIVFKGGKPASTNVGYHDEAKLRAVYEAALQ